MRDSSTNANSESLLLRAEEITVLLGLPLRELYRVAAIPEGQPGALPAGLVVRLGRRVRFSRPRLMDWLGAHRDGDRP